MVKAVPIYSIDRFVKHTVKRSYEIEIFDKNRDFKVTYPHRHDFYEILYITHGSGTHKIDSCRYEIKPNAVFFLSPGQIHSLLLSDDIKGYIFLFTLDFFLAEVPNNNKILEYPFFYSITRENPPFQIIAGSDIDFLVHLFKQGCSENTNRTKQGQQVAHALLILILEFCKRLYPIVALDSRSDKGKMLVKRYKQAIETSYNKNWGISDYASQLAVTPNHLNETIKRHTGHTATQLLNEKIVIEIKRLLIHSDHTISEIAYAFNFSDQSYFSKYFKNLTGQSPIDFRRTIKST